MFSRRYNIYVKIGEATGEKRCKEHEGGGPDEGKRQEARGKTGKATTARSKASAVADADADDDDVEADIKGLMTNIQL